MPKLPLVLVLLVPVAFVAACEPPKTVKAQRYAIVYAESGCDLVHGGGRWVQEIYFPDLRIACMLVYQAKDLLAGKAAEPRLYAFPADHARNELTGIGNAKPSEIEEIEVPAEVAEEIRKLAELTRRWEDETWRLGASLAGAKLMKELPQEDAPR
ncbi:MAG TPA: hypothetical protein VFY93_09015 [Planctomycetota bacterium]|nr:hypothetical protein [Planctomycetota bacterium]